jgi:predicted nucleic acid-binding protein
VVDRCVLDSNVYIHALRSRDQLARLKRFMLRAGTRLHVHAVVALELRAGAPTKGHELAVESLLAPYADRSRVVVPSFEAFRQAGRLLCALSVKERMSLATAPASLTNDALLAASCREAEMVLVTDNARHFDLIRRHLRGFRFVAPGDVLG